MDYREGDEGTYTSGREICMNIRKLQSKQSLERRPEDSTSGKVCDRLASWRQ